MAKKAGANIRDLARSRRGEALAYFVGSGLAVVLIPTLFFLLGQGGLAVLVCIGLGVGAIVLVRQGLHHWKRANRADQGARGEEQLERALQPLVQEGWEVQYNLELNWGDADVFLRSPRHNYYVIDAKAHKSGTVFFDNKSKMLMRRYGRDTIHDLGKNGRGESKDLLKAVKGQATELKKQRRLRWVTAVVCFTQTEIDPSILPEQPVEGVYVVKLSILTWLLLRLDKLERR